MTLLQLGSMRSAKVEEKACSSNGMILYYVAMTSLMSRYDLNYLCKTGLKLDLYVCEQTPFGPIWFISVTETSPLWSQFCYFDPKVI